MFTVVPLRHRQSRLRASDSLSPKRPSLRDDVLEQQRLKLLERLPDGGEVVLEVVRRSPASGGLFVGPRAKADEHVGPIAVSEQCPVGTRKRPHRPVAEFLPRPYEVMLTTWRHRPCCVRPDLIHDAILYRVAGVGRWRGRCDPSAYPSAALVPYSGGSGWLWPCCCPHVNATIRHFPRAGGGWLRW